MKWCSSAVLLAGFVLGAGIAQDAPKSDQDKIQGTWVCHSGLKDGEALSAESVKAIKITFKGNKMTMLTGDSGKPHESSFKLDSSKKPKEITIGEGQKELKGIYAFDGDVLKMCAGQPGGERPKELEAKKGSNLLSMVLKREKP